jgi:hypothetical protein
MNKHERKGTKHNKNCKHSHTGYGFSNCGKHTATGTPTIVYWCMALIKNRNIRRIKI